LDKKTRVDQWASPGWDFHGWDHCFSLDGIIVFHGMGSLFFMDERTVLKAFQGWIRRFPVFSKICFYT
jgi:hypothetical protein